MSTQLSTKMTEEVAQRIPQLQFSLMDNVWQQAHQTACFACGT
ncbi:hypothetical protein AZE42_07428 [Rhizopogon vesiculosus]|uniref:Uncharacterized protein n=1 Tax=Rhizopogon vesiculosus TaxID=180088 RepID=A0A1J8Q4W8_9AGAM|nr:hypothetical protein AZE42_07428 [Rhizopogon vesiculosus]